MKKKISMVLMVILAITFVACSTKKADKVEEKAVSTAAEVSVQKDTDKKEETATKKVEAEKKQDTTVKKVEADKSAAVSTEKVQSAAYEVSKQTFKNKGYQISYPKIQGLSDSNKQNAINELIKKEALKGQNYYKGVEGEVTVEIHYEIKYKSANLLSIQYSGVGNVTKAAHPSNLYYTTNINMNTGKKLRLNEFININSSFVNLFKSEKFKPVNPAQGDIKAVAINEDLTKSFQWADSMDDVGTETQNQSDVFSYFTKDSLGISIPVIHAAGDHAELEIKYKDLDDKVKIKNSIWNGLGNSSTK